MGLAEFLELPAVDPALADKARYMQLFMLAMLAPIFLLLVLAPFSDQGRVVVVTTLLIAFAILVASLILRRGHVLGAGITLATLCWLVALGQLLTQGGLRAPIALTLVPLVFITGYIWNRPAAYVWSGIACVVVVMAFFFHDHLPDPGELAPVRYLGVFIASIMVAALLMAIALGGLENALEEAEEGRLQLESMEAQLRQSQKLESVGTLASGVAHEINNPLHAVMNYAEMIRDASEASADTHLFAQQIMEQSERMAGIVSKLLAFSRRSDSEPRPVDAADIVDAVISLVATSLQNDQIEIEINFADGLPQILCNSSEIQQVILNLVMNARDALNGRYPGYNEEKRIELSTSAHAGMVRITVKDNGGGVSDEAIERLFDPFFTTKPAGTGLGLSVVHGIVRDHGGAISVEGGSLGARFHVDLPSADDD